MEQKAMRRLSEAARRSRGEFEGSQPDWLASLGVIKPTPAAQTVAASRLLSGVLDIGAAPVLLPMLGFDGQACAELLAEYMGLDVEVVRYLADHPSWERNARLLPGPSGSQESAAAFVRWMGMIRDSGTEVLAPGDRVRVRPDFGDVDYDGVGVAPPPVLETCAAEGYDGIVLSVGSDLRALVVWEDDIDGMEDAGDVSPGAGRVVCWQMPVPALVRA